MSEFVLPISGELGIGGVIFNDTQITIEDIPGGHRLIARRGSDVQQMDILNGVDAPIPDIQVSDADHGHDVTITVGDSAQTFHIHDGQDAPIPDIAVEAVEGGHKVTVTVGETVKSFVVLNGTDGEDGADAPIPQVTVSAITGGHRITISVGGTVQSFDVLDGKDGKDAINPTIAITEIEGGHRVTITTGSTVQSFDVMDGKDGTGSGGTVEVDPTLTVEGMAADAAATGAAVAPIAAITETTTSNAITWDGVVGDRVTVDMGEGVCFVRVCDYVPDVPTLVQQSVSCSVVTPDGTVDGHIASDTVSEEGEGLYILTMGESYMPIAFVAEMDNASFADEAGTYVFPKAGTYFYASTTEGIYCTSLTSPLLAVPTTTVRESAIPAVPWEKISDKPFYSEEAEILNCTDVAFDTSQGMLMGMVEAATVASGFVIGAIYTVTWDSAEYICVGKEIPDAGIVAIGNGLFTDGENTGEPFTIIAVDGMAAIYDVGGITEGLETSTHSFTVKGKQVKQIDAEFVPNSDWAANVGQNGFIANKPFGQTGSMTIEIPATTDSSGESFEAFGTTYRRVSDSVDLRGYVSFKERYDDNSNSGELGIAFRNDTGSCMGYSVGGGLRDEAPRFINVVAWDGNSRVYDSVTFTEGLWFIEDSMHEIAAIEFYSGNKMEGYFVDNEAIYSDFRLLSADTGHVFKITVDGDGKLSATKITASSAT